MSRDYSFLPQEYLDHHNQAASRANKRLGDRAENVVANYYRATNHQVTTTSGRQDARGVDLIVDGERINVKCFNQFRLQLQNDYGNTGWLFTYPKKGVRKVIFMYSNNMSKWYTFNTYDMMKWWFNNKDKCLPGHQNPRANETVYYYNSDTQKRARYYVFNDYDIELAISSGLIKVTEIDLKELS